MIVENIGTIKTQVQIPNTARAPVSDALPKDSKPEVKAEPEIKVSQALLNDVQHDIQMMRNVGLQFSVHGATGRTVVRVVDKETQELIREIPPEEFLSLAARLDEMIGILFDKNV
ncbi:MAG: flagellar protein FlaG [Desulfobacterales bacterium]|nr:flagellar protein FlaG [Desulfobacterales bacterium]